MLGLLFYILTQNPSHGCEHSCWLIETDSFVEVRSTKLGYIISVSSLSSPSFILSLPRILQDAKDFKEGVSMGIREIIPQTSVEG